MTKYLPVSGYGMVKSQPWLKIADKFSPMNNFPLCLDTATVCSKDECRNNFESLYHPNMPGHMFEGELTFRIDRVMPEFQASGQVSPSTRLVHAWSFFSCMLRLIPYMKTKG